MSGLLQEILPKLKPYVLGWISDIETSETVGAHELSGTLHTGLLADSQATQFLKLDGSRDLIGNLSVTDGITIDGVDVSAFKSLYDSHILNADAHHNRSHVITGASDHTVTGSQYDLVGLSGVNTLGILTPSSNPGAAAAILRTDASGYLTLVKAVTTTLDTTHLETDDVQTSLIPSVTDTYDLGSSTKLWRSGYISEMNAVLFAENTITLLGGWFWVPHDAGTVAEDVDNSETQIDFGKTMTPNDFVVFRAASAVEYMQIGTLVSGTTYNVTRNLDGSGANTWAQGSPFAVLGASEDGRIELNAYDSPRIQLIKQGATYSAQTEILRIGDLTGNWGSTLWGMAIGRYASGYANITLEDDGTLRFRQYTTEIMKFWNDSGTAKAEILGTLRMPGTGSAITIGATPPTAYNAGTGIWIDRTGLYSLSSGAYQVKIDATNGILYGGEGNVCIGEGGLQLKATASGDSDHATIQFRTSLPDGGIAGGYYHYWGDGGLTSYTKLWCSGYMRLVSSFYMLFDYTLYARFTDKLIIGEASSYTNNTLGLTINQGANDDEIISLKSSDVAHGIIDYTDTNTFGVMRKISSTEGGLMLRGFAEGTTPGVQLQGYITTADTTKSTAGRAAAEVLTYLKSGTGRTSIGADGNLFMVRNNTVTKFIVDAEGDVWYTGDLTSYDGSSSYSVYGYHPLSVPVTSSNTNHDWSTRIGDNATVGPINIGTDFSGIPNTAKAVLMTITIKDSGSNAATTTVYFNIGGSTTWYDNPGIKGNGITNDAEVTGQVVVPLTSSGQFYWTSGASGSSTLMVQLKVDGYFI